MMQHFIGLLNAGVTLHLKVQDTNHFTEALHNNMLSYAGLSKLVAGLVLCPARFIYRVLDGQD